MKLQYAASDVIAQLAKDLVLAETGRFSASDLDGAPLLRNYQVVSAPVGFLTGIVEGHPSLRSGQEIKTSQVFFFDSDRGLARTLNRWYRLQPSVRNGGR